MRCIERNGRKLDKINKAKTENRPLSFPNIGKPIVPVAVVLPKDMLVLDMNLTSGTYLEYPIEGHFAKVYSDIVDRLNYLFVESAPMLGSETINLLNYLTPDAIDIIHEDSRTVDDYPILIDCTGNPDFATAHKENIKSLNDVRDLMNDYLPIRLEGGASMQITKNAETGEQYVLVMNNSGVIRTIEEGEILMPEGEINVSLTMKNGESLCQLEGNGSIVKKEENNYQLSIPSGGWFFAKF